MKKILIIEDEKMLAEMYRDRFIQAGFEVILATDSREGLKATKKEKPDIILLDILLPKENGTYFLAQLKKDVEIASIPVVAFSNFDEPTVKAQAKELGVKEYLMKTDYTPQTIVEKVKNYLK